MGANPRGSVDHFPVGRVYVDFETVEVDNQSYVFQIGMGYWYKNEWFYKSFISLSNVVKNERSLIKRWLIWLEKAEVKEMVHWSSAEKIIYNKIQNRYKNLPKLDEKWVDLLQIFREKFLELEVKGLFGFSLKQVANVLSDYNYIESNYSGCKIQSGFDALLEAQMYFKKNNGRYRFKKEEFKREIEEYNELDCKILGEIDKLFN